jgi:hypothetical protein
MTLLKITVDGEKYQHGERENLCVFTMPVMKTSLLQTLALLLCQAQMNFNISWKVTLVI